jgi:hypothetical protein
MSHRNPSRGAMRRLITKLVVATLGVPASAAAGEAVEIEAEAVDDAEVDAALHLATGGEGGAGAHALAILLDHMRPIDATRAAATAALSPRVDVRAAIGEALTWVFPLLGDTVVIDHLSRDTEATVRLAAARAAHARRTHLDDPALLERLSLDPEASVRDAARLALLGR